MGGGEKKQQDSIAVLTQKILPGVWCGYCLFSSLPLPQDFREKNTDHMRPDIVALLRSSKNAFICGMIGIDPVAVFRWAVLRAFFRAMVAFREAGKRYVEKKTGMCTHHLVLEPVFQQQVGSNVLLPCFK